VSVLLGNCVPVLCVGFVNEGRERLPDIPDSLQCEYDFLARRGDVAGRFYDALASVVVCVKVCSEALEHGDERACGRIAGVRHGVVSFAFVLVHWIER
jgi:hypothetical protein